MLRTQSTLAAAANVIHQLIHQDETRLITRTIGANDLTGWRGHLRLVCCYESKCSLPAELPCNLAPRRFAKRRAVTSASACNGIELRTDKHCGLGFRHVGHPRSGK